MSTDSGTKYIKGTDNTIYAAIMRGKELEEGNSVRGDSRKAAIIVKVMDIPEESGVCYGVC